MGIAFGEIARWFGCWHYCRIFHFDARWASGKYVDFGRATEKMARRDVRGGMVTIRRIFDSMESMDVVRWSRQYIVYHRVNVQGWTVPSAFLPKTGKLNS